MVARSASRLVSCAGVVAGGAFAGGLGQRGVGTLGRNDGIAALGARGGFVVVVTQDRREGLFQVPAEVAGTPTRVSRPLEDCEGCPVLAGVRNPRSGLIPAQLFRFTLQFRRPQQQGRVERLQRAEPGPLKRGCTGRTGRRAEWQALAECVARGGEHAPDTPKSKRALRFSSLADPMPRSLPALPGRQAVPP